MKPCYQVSNVSYLPPRLLIDIIIELAKLNTDVPDKWKFNWKFFKSMATICSKECCKIRLRKYRNRRFNAKAILFNKKH